MEERKLDEIKSLPDIFKRGGLQKVQGKIVGTDNVISDRGHCGHNMIVTFSRLFLDFARMDGSGITVAEVNSLVNAMRKEAEGDDVHMRIDLIAVVGMKPRFLLRL